MCHILFVKFIQACAKIILPTTLERPYPDLVVIKDNTTTVTSAVVVIVLLTVNQLTFDLHVPLTEIDMDSWISFINVPALWAFVT